jgi:hypothetical protein
MITDAYERLADKLAAAITKPVTNAATQEYSKISLRTFAIVGFPVCGLSDLARCFGGVNGTQ